MTAIELATLLTASAWDYATRVLQNEELLADLGFASRESVKEVVIAISAGDRLHPDEGLDYLGTDWRKEGEDVILDRLEERDRQTDQILQSVLTRLELEGYDSACNYARAASKFQVVYLSRTKAGTKENMDTLLNLGLGINELSDNLLEKRGNNLVIGYFEVISYFDLD